MSEKQRQLNKIKDDIEYAFAKGKINEQQYDLLSKKIVNGEYHQKPNK